MIHLQQLLHLHDDLYLQLVRRYDLYCRNNYYVTKALYYNNSSTSMLYIYSSYVTMTYLQQLLHLHDLYLQPPRHYDLHYALDCRKHYYVTKAYSTTPTLSPWLYLQLLRHYDLLTTTPTSAWSIFTALT